MDGEQAARETATTSTGSAAELLAASEDAGDAAPQGSRRVRLTSQIRNLVHVIREGSDAQVEEAVIDLSRRHRYYAPLAFVVSAFVMLFEGVRLLVSNWRLTLIEILPAMWIWLAMLDLKAHLLHGKTLHVLRGPILIPLVLAVMAITVGSFFLNAVFAFAIARPGAPQIRPAFAQARSHLAVIFLSGGLIGLALGFATLVVTRWGLWWFAISLSIVVGVMMVAYVAVPSRLIGMKTTYSKQDALKATAVGGALGAVICSPPYALGRIGILMLGSKALFIPGIFVLAVGVTLQAGATGAVKAVKMSAKLVAGTRPAAGGATPAGGPPASGAPASGA
jgi:hypothetical protein